MSEEELQQIIEQGEGLHVEFKRNVNKDLQNEMVAFANSSGGKVLLGVDKHRNIKGIDLNDDKRAQINDIARDSDPTIQIELEDLGDVAVVHVPEGKNKPYRGSKGFYIRQGDTSQKLKRDEIVDFIQREGRVRFDDQVRRDVSYPQAVDIRALQRFMEEAGVDHQQYQPERFLQNHGLFKGEGNELYLTNAALLFFSSQLDRDLPQATVQCVAFKGRDKTDILDRKVLEGDLLSNIHDSILFLRRHLNQGASIEGIRREDELEIPEVALREAVVNAVAHRDYLIEGAHVVIEVYKDRVEISNPGGLPPGFPEDQFGKRSLARNPVIVDLLRRAGYIEKLGTGIERIKRELADAQLPEPEFHYDSFFSVILSRPIGEQETEEKAGDRDTVHDTEGDTVFNSEKENLTLNDIISDTVNDTVPDTVNDTVKERLERIIELIYKEPGLHSHTIAERMEVTPVTVRRHIQKLGPLVSFEGPPKTGGYYLTEELKAKLDTIK